MDCVMTRDELKSIIKECYFEIKSDNENINESIESLLEFNVSDTIEKIKTVIKTAIEKLLAKAKRIKEKFKASKVGKGIDTLITKIKGLFHKADDIKEKSDADKLKEEVEEINEVMDNLCDNPKANHRMFVDDFNWSVIRDCCKELNNENKNVVQYVLDYSFKEKGSKKWNGLAGRTLSQTNKKDISNNLEYFPKRVLLVGSDHDGNTISSYNIAFTNIDTNLQAKLIENDGSIVIEL